MHENVPSCALCCRNLNNMVGFAEDNARDFISSGGLKELIEISDESAREDIRNLAKKTLRLSSLFRGELRAE